MENLTIDDVVKIVLALLAIAEIVVRITPTAKDNSIVNAIKRGVDFLIINKKSDGGQHL